MGVTNFANFTFTIQRHGHDMKTKQKKIILDCTVISSGEQFPLVLDSTDMDIESNFFKAYYAQKPAKVPSKLKQQEFKWGKVLKNISSMDENYIPTEDKKVLILTEPGFFVDDDQNLEFYCGVH